MSVKITSVPDRVFVPTWWACSLISSFKNVAATLTKCNLQIIHNKAVFCEAFPAFVIVLEIIWEKVGRKLGVSGGARDNLIGITMAIIILVAFSSNQARPNDYVICSHRHSPRPDHGQPSTSASAHPLPRRRPLSPSLSPSSGRLDSHAHPAPSRRQL